MSDTIRKQVVKVEHRKKKKVEHRTIDSQG